MDRQPFCTSIMIRDGASSPWRRWRVCMHEHPGETAGSYLPVFHFRYSTAKHVKSMWGVENWGPIRGANTPKGFLKTNATVIAVKQQRGSFGRAPLEVANAAVALAAGGVCPCSILCPPLLLLRLRGRGRPG